MTRFLVQFARIFVGVLFIFSGYIKLNDPMGFGFKLEEYFAEGVLNLPFLAPIAMQMAVVICIAEILLGFSLLLGFWRKFTSWSLLIMIVFFTFLTFYSAYFNKVTDCGCFGDAIPLTPWQSFGKDVILSVLIVLLFFNQKAIQPIFRASWNYSTLGVVLIACVVFVNHVLNHLPVQDFRAYKIGTNIIEGRMTAEELGVEGPVYESFFFFDDGQGNLVEVNGTDYIKDKWYEKTEYTMVDSLSESRKVKDGYEPPIHDFSLEVDTGDITDWVLAQPEMILVLSYELNKASESGLDAISAWSAGLDDLGYDILGWTGSTYEERTEMVEKYQLPFEFAVGDGTAVKTVVRSNPGIVALKNGVIVGKWHWNDRPSTVELEALFK